MKAWSQIHWLSLYKIKAKTKQDKDQKKNPQKNKGENITLVQ